MNLLFVVSSEDAACEVLGTWTENIIVSQITYLRGDKQAAAFLSRTDEYDARPPLDLVVLDNDLTPQDVAAYLRLAEAGRFIDMPVDLSEFLLAAELESLLTAYVIAAPMGQ